jgi:class 3 adenylate cyclase
VLGDTVNVASRLERLTRHTASSLMVSDDLIRAVHGCGAEPMVIVEGLHRDQARIVRGRHQPIAVWRVAAITDTTVIGTATRAPSSPREFEGSAQFELSLVVA